MQNLATSAAPVCMYRYKHTVLTCKQKSNWSKQGVDDGHHYCQGEVSVWLSAHNNPVPDGWVAEDGISRHQNLLGVGVIHIRLVGGGHCTWVSHADSGEKSTHRIRK